MTINNNIHEDCKYIEIGGHQIPFIKDNFLEENILIDQSIEVSYVDFWDIGQPDYKGYSIIEHSFLLPKKTIISDIESNRIDKYIRERVVKGFPMSEKELEEKHNIKLLLKLTMSLQKITDKLNDLTPEFMFRLSDTISTKYYNLTSSFTNWRNGYGWFPDVDAFNLDYAISRFALPRIKRLIDYDLHGVPAQFSDAIDGDSIQAWKNILRKIQVAFMEQEEWFKWKYLNQKHPIYDTDINKTIPLAVKTDDEHLLDLNPKFMGQFNWDEVYKYTDEYNKEYKEGCKLLGEYFGNLWD